MTGRGPRVPKRVSNAAPRPTVHATYSAKNPMTPRNQVIGQSGAGIRPKVRAEQTDRRDDDDADGQRDEGRAIRPGGPPSEPQDDSGESDQHGQQEAEDRERHEHQQRNADDRHGQHDDAEHQHRHEQQLREEPGESAHPRLARGPLANPLDDARSGEHRDEDEHQHDPQSQERADQAEPAGEHVPPDERAEKEPGMELEVRRAESDFVDVPADDGAVRLLDATADRRHVASHHGFRSQVHAAAYRHDVVVHVPKHGDAAAHGHDRIGDTLVGFDRDVAADVDARGAAAPMLLVGLVVGVLVRGLGCRRR